MLALYIVSKINPTSFNWCISSIAINSFEVSIKIDIFDFFKTNIKNAVQ